MTDKLYIDVDEMIREVYPVDGWKPIHERFGVSRSFLYTRVKQLGVPHKKPKDPRDPEINEMIREVYPVAGWRPISEKYGITKDTVKTRARTMGVQVDTQIRKSKNFEITRMIREVYPTEGWEPIAKHFGLTQAAVQIRARKAGVQCRKREWYERTSRTKLELFDKLDLSIWTPELTDVGAYYLGLAWADATVRYKNADESIGRLSSYHVRFCQSGEDDKEVVYELARRLNLPESRVRPVKKYEERHKIPYGLKLSGKRIAGLFRDHFGIPMRKSYIDPPYPTNIDDYSLPGFACGLMDGDGSKVLYLPNSPNPHYGFYGSPRFLDEFRERLGRAVGVKFRPIRPHTQRKTLWLFGVYDVRQTVPLTRYLYQYYGQPGVPYLRRKHDCFERFLTPGYFSIRGGYQRYL